jgi:hypothetical protein
LKDFRLDAVALATQPAISFSLGGAVVIISPTGGYLRANWFKKKSEFHPGFSARKSSTALPRLVSGFLVLWMLDAIKPSIDQKNNRSRA